MKTQPGEQIRLNERPAVIVSVLECPTYEIVTLFWPATLAPPVVAGTPRPGVWRSKTITLWHYRDDGSWLLVRASGTEPLVRVYTEATSPELREDLLQAGERLVRGT